MRRQFAALFGVVALTACSSPMEEFFPLQRLSIEDAGRTYDVVAKYDPFEFKWWTRVSVADQKLGIDTQPAVQSMVQDKVGPRLCGEGKRIEVVPARVWSGFGATTLRHLPENGTWVMVGSCA